MTRPDLFALSDAVLEDLTNKGTVRRARREVDQVTCTISEQPDGTVVVDAVDATCTLFVDRPFDEWTCTCLAAHGCRHIVRAVLSYQAGGRSDPATDQPADEAEPADSAGQTDTVDQNGAELGPADGVLRSDAFDPAEIADQDLSAALAPALSRRAGKLAQAGTLAQVGSLRGIGVVRLSYPVPVTVRFLAGADLNYVRCTCHEPDPCVHVPVAVAAARGQPFGDTGLRVSPGDRWRPDLDLVCAIRDAVLELVQVGAEAGHRHLSGVWRRLSARARAQDLHHLADLLDELLDELARYDGRSQIFDPSGLVRRTGELLARCASLANPDPGRVPDRLVAGSPPQEIRVGRARLVGLGTEFTETDTDCRLVAHLIDARSGAPMRVTKRIVDEDTTPSWKLATSLVSGIGIGAWGGGQVMTRGGRIFGHGDFAHTNRPVAGLPAGALDQIEAPFRVDTVADLAHQQTRLPAVLSDRAAGTDLAACRVSGVRAIAYQPSVSSLWAELLDAAGKPFRLCLRHGRRTGDSLRATWAWLVDWQSRFPAEAYVSGRWHWCGETATVDPFLLVGDQVPFQPQIAQPAACAVDLELAHPAGPLTTPGALLAVVDRLLGELLVAGADRIRRHDPAWRDFAKQARQAGSGLVADTAQRFIAGDPQAAARLLLISAFGHPLV